MKKIKGTNEYNSEPHIANFSVKMETLNKNYFSCYKDHYTLYKEKIADIEYAGGNDIPEDKVYKNGESWRTGKRHTIDGNLIDRCELCNKKRKDLYKFYYTELNDTERKYILVCHKDVKELLKCYPENSSNYIYWYLPPEQREIVALMRLKKKYDISSKNNSNK